MSTSRDVASTASSLPGSAAGSPRSKVKFLCSHGGKILPRPVDGHLKYVGGETRVISVHRDITFVDLMKKLSSLIEGDVVLKYQMIPEELDALITVKSNEDLRHMFEEYDLTGTPRLRTFLFPANPIIIENQMGPMDRHSLEQRYINSVNGIIVNNTRPIYNHNNNTTTRPPTMNTSQTSFTISSACSSPRTPQETAMPAANPDVINPEITGLHKLGAITRARSSPNLFNHKNLTPVSTLDLDLTNHQYPYHHHHHRQPQPPPPYHHPQPYTKPRLDPIPHKSSGPDHLMRVGSADYYRHLIDHAPNPYGRSSRVYQRGSPYDHEYYGNNNINRYDRESSPR